MACEIVGRIARSKALDPAVLTPGTTLEELAIDSLDRINLTFDLEEHYGIAVPDEALLKLRTVGDVIDGVERLLAEKAARD